jgi:pimeloyl-ACP methyl ester carboxylesterase
VLPVIFIHGLIGAFGVPSTSSLRPDLLGYGAQAQADPGEIEQILRAEPAIAHALDYQPATTVRAMARAVVEFTGDPGYERLLRDVFTRTPVHLVAGARSRAGWDVPDWALAAAASYTEIPDAGHMVMDEAPEAFGELLARLLD